jgi:hypothetical protein
MQSTFEVTVLSKKTLQLKDISEIWIYEKSYSENLHQTEVVLDDSCRILCASSLTTLVSKGVSFSWGIDQNIQNQIDGESTMAKVGYEIKRCLFHATILKNMKIYSPTLRQFCQFHRAPFPFIMATAKTSRSLFSEIMKGECRWTDDAFSPISRQPN